MSEKRLLQASILLVRSLKIINNSEMMEIGAVADLRSYLISQESVNGHHPWLVCKVLTCSGSRCVISLLTSCKVISTSRAFGVIQDGRRMFRISSHVRPSLSRNIFLTTKTPDSPEGRFRGGFRSFNFPCGATCLPDKPLQPLISTHQAHSFYE